MEEKSSKEQVSFVQATSVSALLFLCITSSIYCKEENFETNKVASVLDCVNSHFFFAGDTQEIPAVSGSHDSHAFEEVPS